MNANSSTILVTGGAGYIGSHACKALSRAGYRPIAYDNLVCGHEWAVKWGPFESGDLLNRSRLDEVIRQYEPEAIMHFAAYIAVGESVSDPGKYYRNNVAGSLTLLEAARDYGINRFVFSSTAAVYGVPQTNPIQEGAPLKPVSPYGFTKLFIERILKDFDAAYGLRSIALRYFNAAGADPDNEVGESHDPETHIIPLVLDAVSGRRSNVTIFGDDYDTTDGTCIRDYIHVADLADAHVAALKALESGAASNAYNLGNGQGFSVREVLSAVERVTGLSVPATLGARRAGDPAVLVSDASKAGEELGWRPKIADLTDIVRTAWAWHQLGAPTKTQVDAHAQAARQQLF